MYKIRRDHEKFIENSISGSVLRNSIKCIVPNLGKILLFSSRMPNKGFGVINRIEDIKLISTDKEKLLYNPKTNDYLSLANFCLENRIVIDLFQFGSKYFDFATVHPLATLTGGSVYYYPNLINSNA